MKMKFWRATWKTCTGNLGEKFEENPVVEYVQSNINGNGSEGDS